MNVIEIEIEAEPVDSPKHALVRLTLSCGLVTVTGLMTADDCVGHGQMMAKVGGAARRAHKARKTTAARAAQADRHASRPKR